MATESQRQSLESWSETSVTWWTKSRWVRSGVEVKVIMVNYTLVLS